MSTFPIYPVPDPNDDGFKEPGCEECEGDGYLESMCVRDKVVVVKRRTCDCQYEEEDE